MLRGEDIRHLAAIVALPLVLVLAAASPAGGSTGSNDRAEGALYSIRIEGASVDRPVLDRLVRTADIRGITLAEAIDRHVGDLGVSELEPGGTSREATTLPEIMIDDIHLAELEDMKLIAERDGLSLVEAIDSHAWQSRFLELADTVESSYPDQFSGAGIGSSSAGRSAWFGFKDGIPAEVAGVVGSLPTTVELVGGKGFSETELVETLHVAHDQIYARQDVVNVHPYLSSSGGTRDGIVS